MNKNKIFNIKKITYFVSVYTMLLSICGFILGFIICRPISILIMLTYFLIENKKIKEWRFVLTYTLFISLILEFSNFAGYRINYFCMQLLGISETATDTNLLLVMSISLALHFCILILIYKINFIKINTIKELSTQKLVPIFFTLCLSMFIYIKYQIKQMQSYSYFYEVLSAILLFFLPIFLCSYIILHKLVRLKNIDHNEVEGTVTENIFALNIPAINAVTNLSSDVYEKDRKIFKRKLAKLEINHGCQGYNQIILALAIIKHFTGDELILEENVLRHVSRITKVPARLIRNNIEDTIKKTWLHVDSEILEQEYTEDYTGRKRPEIKDFLVYIAKNSA